MSTTTITLRFTDLGWPIVAPVISFVSGHWANHVDLMVDETAMVSALPLKVRERPLDRHKSREEFITLTCTPWQKDQAIAFARQQIGKYYDVLGVFWFPFRPRWNDDRAWFCSELTAAALHEAGIIYVPRKTHRVSPGELYALAIENGATVSTKRMTRGGAIHVAHNL